MTVDTKVGHSGVAGRNIVPSRNKDVGLTGNTGITTNIRLGLMMEWEDSVS